MLLDDGTGKVSSSCVDNVGFVDFSLGGASRTSLEMLTIYRARHGILVTFGQHDALLIVRIDCIGADWITL